MIAAGVLAVLTNLALNQRAARQADEVIAAVERHRRGRGAYPQELDALVPAYLPSVPRAKPGAFGAFQYVAQGEGALLVWVVVPPFGRRTYDFERRRAGSLD